MNEESQRIAIAKIEGYTLREEGIWQDPDGEYVGGWRSLPDYTRDLNAMHKVEPLLGDGYKRVHYLDSLGWVCRRDGMKVPWLECPFANAAQKAESFLYVFGLWEDDAAAPMEKCEWADHPKDIEPPQEKHRWYPRNSFERFAKPVCGTSCKVCKGFALEIEEDRERPCPVCYPGPADSSLDSENAKEHTTPRNEA